MHTYETHVVKLIRKNNKDAVHIDTESDDKVNMEDSEYLDRFFMFDYFDLLLHKQMKDMNKKYTDYLGMEESFLDLEYNGVSNKTLALYKYDVTDEKTDDSPLDQSELWLGGQEEYKCEFLSDTPFIGLVQIVINPCRYDSKKTKADDDFISGCYIEVMKIVNDYMDNNSLLRYEIYNTLTTGDFCLVIRTDNVESIYYISNMIATHQTQLEDSSYAAYTTYTNIGLECTSNPYKAGLKYLTLSEDCIRKNEQNEISIRFSCQDEYMDTLLKYQKEADLKGVFGRYDLLLRLSMRQFALVYPYLCEIKIAEAYPQTHVPNEPAVTSLMDALIYGIQEGYIYNINERVLSLPASLKGNKGLVNYYKKPDFLNFIKKKYKQLEEWEIYFVNGRRNYLDVKRALKELINVYASLQFGTDSYLNGLLQKNYILALFENLEKAMRVIRLNNSEELRIRFIEDFKTCVEAINQFTKYIQSINLLTVQAPQYEIQTKLDSEKLIIAYHEYMNIHLSAYSDYLEANNPKGAKQCMMPIIYPDFTVNRVVVEAPFCENFGSDEVVPCIVVCRVPSFEYFGRIYDLLPWLSHEIGHNMLILDRTSRNEQLIDMIFEYIFQNVVQKWLSDNDKDSLILRYGILKNELQVILKEEFIELYKETRLQNQINIIRMMELERDIINFFEGFVDEKRGYILYDLNYRVTKKEGMKKIVGSIIDLLLRYQAQSEGDIKGLEEILANLCKPLTLENKQEEKAFLERLLLAICSSARRIYDMSLQQMRTKCRSLPDITMDWMIVDEAALDQMLLMQAQLYMKDNEYSSEEDKTRKQAVLREYFYLIKQLNNLYQSYIKLMQVNLSSRDDNELFEYKIYRRIRQRLQLICASENRTLNIFDPHLNHVLKATGYRCDEFPEDDHRILTSLFDSMKRLTLVDILNWKNHSVEVYRETCADIVMCKIMKLSPFGYFKLMMLSAGDTDYNLDEFRWDMINMLRMRLVISVLFSKRYTDTSAPEVKEISTAIIAMKHNLKEYFSKLLNDLQQTIIAELHEEYELERPSRDIVQCNDNYCRDVIKLAGEQANIYMDHIEMLVIDNDELNSIYSSPIIWEDITNQKAHSSQIYVILKLKKYKYIFNRIHIMIKGFSSLLYGTDLLKQQEGLLLHLVEIYDKLDFIPEARDCILEITKYYNSDYDSDNLNAGKKLDCLIDFTKWYYYANRLRLSV